MDKALPYRFDDLGWLQFDRLCAALLDLDSVAWEERDFGRVGLVPDGVASPPGGPQLAAPTLVVVAWLGPSGSRSRRSRLRRLLAAELERAPAATVGSVLVVTNAQAPVDDVPVPLVQLGPERLGELVDADPQLRLRVPSVLGIRDLGGLITGELTARSTADAAAAADLARVFVPTRAHQVFAAFVAAATQPPGEAEELVTQILNRIGRVAPAYAPAAVQATQALAAKDEPWFEVRFETHPRRPEPAPTDRIFVERVLRDLS